MKWDRGRPDPIGRKYFPARRQRKRYRRSNFVSKMTLCDVSWDVIIDDSTQASSRTPRLSDPKARRSSRTDHSGVVERRRRCSRSFLRMRNDHRGGRKAEPRMDRDRRYAPCRRIDETTAERLFGMLPTKAGISTHTCELSRMRHHVALSGQASAGYQARSRVDAADASALSSLTASSASPKTSTVHGNLPRKTSMVSNGGSFRLSEQRPLVPRPERRKARKARTAVSTV